jgi:small neutral amino acid transporter SnatA (MarC family)
LSLWNSFPIAFSVLLPLINPLGSALAFLGLVSLPSDEDYGNRCVGRDQLLELQAVQLWHLKIQNQTRTRSMWAIF